MPGPTVSYQLWMTDFWEPFWLFVEHSNNIESSKHTQNLLSGALRYFSDSAFISSADADSSWMAHCSGNFYNGIYICTETTCSINKYCVTKVFRLRFGTKVIKYKKTFSGTSKLCSCNCCSKIFLALNVDQYPVKAAINAGFGWMLGRSKTSRIYSILDLLGFSTIGLISLSISCPSSIIR